MQVQQKRKKDIRRKILKSAINSFKIEGINIPLSTAKDTLKKVELSLKK